MAININLNNPEHLTTIIWTHLGSPFRQNLPGDEAVRFIDRKIARWATGNDSSIEAIDGSKEIEKLFVYSPDTGEIEIIEIQNI